MKKYLLAAALLVSTFGFSIPAHADRGERIAKDTLHDLIHAAKKQDMSRFNELLAFNMFTIEQRQNLMLSVRNMALSYKDIDLDVTAHEYEGVFYGKGTTTGWSPKGNYYIRMRGEESVNPALADNLGLGDAVISCSHGDCSVSSLSLMSFESRDKMQPIPEPVINQDQKEFQDQGGQQQDQGEQGQQGS